MNRHVSVTAAFAVSFLAIALPYWQIPYSQIALPNSLFGVGTGIAFVLSAILRLDRSRGLASIILSCGGAFPAVVLLRVIYDVLVDSTSHNLWPFEVIIASIFGLVVSVMGGVIGGIFASVLNRDKGSGSDTGDS